MQKEKVLEVINLTKKYDLFTLENISFSVEKGQITGFIGINGAGKTTTIKSLAGLVIPNGGKIQFFGEKLTTKNESRIRDRIGFLFDGDYFYPEFTVRQMKNIFSKTYTNWDEKIFKELVSKFNLPLKQKISKFSKGMKVKFSLALALSHHAEILIMDEPTSGLDPLVRAELIEIFKRLAENGTSILFSSHITSDLEDVADNIVLINKGKIIFQEETDALESKYFVVKDKVEILNDENKTLFLKIKKDKNKFKGIYCGNKEKILEAFPDSKIENANIEDIMLANVFKNH